MSFYGSLSLCKLMCFIIFLLILFYCFFNFASQLNSDLLSSDPDLSNEGGSNFWVLPDPILWQYVMA